MLPRVACGLILAASLSPAVEAFHPGSAATGGGALERRAPRQQLHQPRRGGLAPLRYDKDGKEAEQDSAARLESLDATLSSFLKAGTSSVVSGSSSFEEEELIEGASALDSFFGAGGPKLSPKPRGTSASASSRPAKASKLALQDESVPASQQPAQELEDLKEAPFFSMASLEDGDFLKQLRNVYLTMLIFPSLPISLITYPLFEAPIQALCSANLGAVAVTVLFMIRLYVGWNYVADRLSKDVGYYEDSGWYDGFLAVKPPEIRQRDQLLFRFEVSPALERIKKFTLLGGGVLVASVVLFNTAAPSDPYEYLNEDYLQRVKQDDGAAMIEGRRTNSGKPTYCDSRYYKAVAGGSGC